MMRMPKATILQPIAAVNPEAIFWNSDDTHTGLLKPYRSAKRLAGLGPSCQRKTVVLVSALLRGQNGECRRELSRYLDRCKRGRARQLWRKPGTICTRPGGLCIGVSLKVTVVPRALGSRGTVRLQSRSLGRIKPGHDGVGPSVKSNANPRLPDAGI